MEVLYDKNFDSGFPELDFLLRMVRNGSYRQGFIQKRRDRRDQWQATNAESRQALARRCTANQRRQRKSVGGSGRTAQGITLDQRIGGTYVEPEKPEVRIARGENSHYFTPGRINNRPVNFVVDTGASSIAMHTQQADALGLPYRRGKVMMVGTANGMTEAYKVMLHNVSVGNVVVNNVEAVVMDGMSRDYILLGNSYLSKVDMKVDSGVLVLQAKF